jgi:signal transduction histidine kinase
MGLIRDLLDVSKMEAGRFVVHQENVFLWPIIERAVSTIEPAAKAKALNVVREIDDFEIAADEDRIVQVMINLLNNAAKWAPDGSTIKVAATTASPGFVKISVQDSGPGIPPEEQPLVFERFYQSGDNESKAKGTGLGLAICKAIVHAHGGEISVTSQPGDTTFSFTLPLVPPSAELAEDDGSEGNSLTTDDGRGELVADAVHVGNE